MNNLRHPFRAAALAALLCLALAPPTALAQFSYNGNNYTTLYAAFTAMNGASGTILVTDDTGTCGTGTCDINPGQILTLKSDTPGTQRTIRRLAVTEWVLQFNIKSNGTLIVEDIIFDFLGSLYDNNIDTLPYYNLYQTYKFQFIENRSTKPLTLDNCTLKNYWYDYLRAIIYGVSPSPEHYNPGPVGPIRSYITTGDFTINCPRGLTFENFSGWDWIEEVLAAQCYGGCIYVSDRRSNCIINGNITASNIYNNGGLGDVTYHTWGESPKQGGVIYAEGNITINGNANFNECWARREGGAIYTNKALTINGDANFSGCKITKLTPWDYAWACGGGICAYSGVTINGNANFTDCTNNLNWPWVQLGDGGGIYVMIGDVYIKGDATFAGCNTQNKGLENSDNLHTGGGICTKVGNVTIDGNAVFTNCEAFNGGAIYAGVKFGSTVDPTKGNLLIKGNAQFKGCIVGGNTAGMNLDKKGAGNGGAIYASGDITIVGTAGATFEDCQAYAYVMSTLGRGGAVYVKGDLNIPNGATFTNCRANDADAHAGGIAFGGTTQMTVTGDMVFTNCYSAGKGGGMSLLSGELIVNGNITGSGCTANNGSGGCVFTDAPMTINGTVDITDSESTKYHGGGLAALHGTVTANGTVNITNCTAKQNGGGIYAESAVTLNALGNTITGNTATDGNGGGIFCTGGLIKNTTLGGNAANKNTAGNNGGGIFNNGGTLTFESNQNHVTHNEANNNGGGIYNNNGGTINFNADPNVSDNQATHGGGIYNATGGTLNFNAPMDINNNTATKNGGGVFNNGTFNSTGSTAIAIEGNQADNGGGIYNTSVLTMTSSGTQTIARNTATNNGGGIWTNGVGGTLTPIEVEEMVHGVEYIEVNTGQISVAAPTDVAYINTGITFSGGHKTWARGLKGNGNLFMFYAFTGTGNSERAGYKILNGNIQHAWPNKGNTTNSNYSNVPNLTNNPPVIEVEQDASHLKITANGASDNFTYSGSTSATLTATWTLMRPYVSSSNSVGRLYEAKIWDGSGTLIGHYIPCRRASGEVGVYDAVTRKFLGNAGSAGSFTAGNDNGQTHTAIVTAYAPMNVVTLNNITIGGSAADKNTATNGAGIYVEGNGITLGNNCTVSYNEASNNGGGVYNNTSATVAFIGTDTNIDYNKANNNGGGLYNTSTLEYDNDNAGFTAQHNSANDGGGVYADGQGNTTLLQNAIVKDNTASRNGGGGYVNTNAIMQLDGFSTTGVLFQQNHAGTHGGGIYKLGTLKVQGLIDITENTAGQ